MTRALSLVLLSGLLVAGCESSDNPPANPVAPSPAPQPTAARIDLTATPVRFLLSNSGTAVTITARLVDSAGTGLANRPMQFTTTSGSLSAAQVNTGATGDATVTLTTSESATVQASAAGIGGTVSVVGVAPFTVSVEPRYSVVGVSEDDDVVVTVTPAQGFPSVPTPSSVTLDCGNGVTTDLGSSRRGTCRYSTRGTYTVKATATAPGWTATGTATITLEPRPVTLSLTSRRVAGTATIVEMEFTVAGAPSGSVCAWELSATSRTGDCTQRYVYAREDADSNGEVKISVKVDTKQGQDAQTLELTVALPFQ